MKYLCGIIITTYIKLKGHAARWSPTLIWHKVTWLVQMLFMWWHPQHSPALSLLICLTDSVSLIFFGLMPFALISLPRCPYFNQTTFFFFFPLSSSQLTIAFHVLVSLCPTTTTTNNNNNYFFLVIFFRDIVFSSHYMYVLWRIKIMA